MVGVLSFEHYLMKVFDKDFLACYPKDLFESQ